MLSIVTPAFNEAANLELLHERIVGALTVLGIDWEWLIVDDHSRDETFGVIERMAAIDRRVRGIRLARNSGSHVAVICGLHHVEGDAVVMMAADMQDPPETIGALVTEWRAGAQVVWATRRERPGDRSHAGFASLYYVIMRNIVGMTNMPARGADFFLIDRAVIDAVKRHKERNVSVLALITSLGFRQAHVEYHKQLRATGRSGWTLQRKIKLVLDSVIGFSEAPIRACWYLGAALVISAGVFGTFAVSRRSVGLILLATMVGLTGVQLVALGIVGEYVWRTLEEARDRPQYLIEAITGVVSDKRAVSGR